MHSLPDLSWFNRVFVLKLLSVDDVFSRSPETNLGLGSARREKTLIHAAVAGSPSRHPFSMARC